MGSVSVHVWNSDRERHQRGADQHRPDDREVVGQRVRDGGFGYGGDGHFDVSANSTTYSGCYGSKDAMIDGCHVTYYGLHENVKENQEFILLE